jgi:predicted nucleic acid-binding protein
LTKEFLFDTNALLYIIAARKYQKLDRKNYRILDLTFYEYGNAILNILAKRGRQPSKEEISFLVQAFEKITELASSVNLEGRMMQPIMDLARKENLTFYDASYLHCCLHFDLHLITEDGRLKQAAQNNSISVIDCERWLKSLR